MISSVEIGDRITFRPAFWKAMQSSGGRGGQNRIEEGTIVTGTVDYINEDHRWFRVRYEEGGIMHHECFPLTPKPPPRIEGRKKRTGQHHALNF